MDRDFWYLAVFLVTTDFICLQDYFSGSESEASHTHKYPSASTTQKHMGEWVTWIPNLNPQRTGNITTI